MRISIIGGGPGGFYLAILIKKARPDWQVELFEQTAPTTPSASASSSRTKR